MKTTLITHFPIWMNLGIYLLVNILLPFAYSQSHLDTIYPAAWAGNSILLRC